MRYKYPRTYHLPWSKAMAADDKTLNDISGLLNVDIVITEKMDGENTTIYNDYTHARSISSSNHPSRDIIKNMLGAIGPFLNDNERLCGENLFAKHSIYYENLQAYFYLFSVWRNDICLSWDDVETYASILQIPLVPVLFKGQVTTDKELETVTKINKKL